MDGEHEWAFFELWVGKRIVHEMTGIFWRSEIEAR